MKRTRTSKSWMSEHVSDSFVKQAQIDGYRSRAAYKLIEINEKFKEQASESEKILTECGFLLKEKYHAVEETYNQIWFKD